MSVFFLTEKSAIARFYSVRSFLPIELADQGRLTSSFVEQPIVSSMTNWFGITQGASHVVLECDVVFFDGNKKSPARLFSDGAAQILVCF